MTEVKLNFNYIPLSFMSSNEEVKRQIKNTVIMQYVLNKYKNPVKLVEQLVDTRYGYTASSKEEGTHKFLRITDIKDGKVDWGSVPFCECLNDTGYLLERGDILVARTGGTTGKSLLISETKFPSVFASYLIRLRTSKCLKPEFLNLFLNSFVYWNQIVELKQGSAQPNVNAEKLKGLIIPYCDIEIQEDLLQIADSMYQNKDFHPQLIEVSKNIEFVINKFDETEKLKVLFDNQKHHASSLRQSILQEAVQGKLVLQDPNDEPAGVVLEKIRTEKEQLIKEKKIKKEKSLPLITEDDIPYELPEGWEWVRWGEVIFSVDGGWSPKCHDYPAKFPEWGVLKISAVTWGEFKPNENKFLPEMKSEKAKFEVKAGDFLISRANTAELVARSVIVEATPERLLLSDKILRLLFTDKTIPAYLNLVNRSPYARKYYSDIATGTSDSMKNVSQEQIKGLLIPLPPLNEQKRIVEKVDQLVSLCDELEKTVEQSMHASEMLMKAVLQEAFNFTNVNDNVLDLSSANSSDIENWEIAARSDGEIDSKTKAKIKNRVTELLGKSQQ